jgi:hypothetical protein
VIASSSIYGKEHDLLSMERIRAVAIEHSRERVL